MRVAIKYCGSCNPYIDLIGIAQEFRAGAEVKGVTFVPLDAEDIDLLVILNGCTVACADRPDVRDKAPRSLGVTPEMVGRTLVRGEEIPQAMERILEKEMLDEPN
jgi:hypothetical protein